uniref:Uncharacterized protein n=1 Tax=Avena sativa TaxID=4498 RepID=A0ACD5UYG8_AVESA
MEWWNHLWLNEGFATWMSYYAIDYLFPQWNIWIGFIEGTISTLRSDSLAGSHPIEVEIHHISEIDGIFDDIIYNKGGTILRMLQSYLGTERFQKALAAYIKKYAYSNANTEDLWAVLEAETGEPLKDYMSAWTKKPGYPVINVKREGKGIHLEQDPFSLDGSSRSGLWDVPITLSCASSTKKFILKQKYYNLDSCGKQEKDGNFLIKLNINETGFYRVKYDKEIAAKLQNALETNMFSSVEKIGIVENALKISVARKDTLSSLLYMLYAYREEGNYIVLKHLIDIISVVAKVSIDATPNLVGEIKQLLIKVLQSPTVKLGWDPINGEDDHDASLREMLLVSLVKLGHNKSINEGVRRFYALIHDHNTSILSPHTRRAAYLSVMQIVSSTNRSGYNALREVYKNSTDMEEKLCVLGVLLSCRDKDVLLESLNLILTNEIPNQDAVHVLEFTSIDARETTWNWLKENWDRVLEVVPQSDLLWCIVNNIVPLFTSNDKAEEISKFFTNYKDPKFQTVLKRNLNDVLISMRWIDGIRSEPELAQTVHELLHKV